MPALTKLTTSRIVVISRIVPQFDWRLSGFALLFGCIALLVNPPALWGNGWPSPVAMPNSRNNDKLEMDEVRFQTVSRLTLSFAPDGTPISSHNSSLFSSFSDLLDEQELEGLVLSAFQTWAQHSAINVGVVADSGDAFGIGGQSQGDLRFGDVRVGAVPMAGDVFAVAVPNVDLVSGTWSGDLLFNSNAAFTDANQFYAVALHEAGHVLGLGHSDDTTSVMHPTALTGELNETDISDLRALYGDRVELDRFDRPDIGDDGKDENSNDSASKAVEIRNTGSVDGIIPLVVYGDIENQSDIDFFQIQPNSGYAGRLSIRLLSRHVSMLQGRVTITDQSGKILATNEESSTRGTDISVSLESVSEEQDYFIQIESVGMPENQFGSYALVATFDDNLMFGSELVELAARRNYSDLEQQEIQNLFLSELTGPIADDLHTNDTPSTATVLQARSNIALHSTYRIQASIADTTDIDFYQAMALDSVMSIRVNAFEAPGLISVLQVLDTNHVPLAGKIKVNGNGELLVEYAGLVVGEHYFVGLSADRPESEFGVGNYDLNIAFSNLERDFEQLAYGHLDRFQPTQTQTLYVARSQLFHFALDGQTTPADRHSTTIWMSIYDDQGELRYRLATRSGETRSSMSVVLTPGGYSIRMHLAQRGQFNIAKNTGESRVPSTDRSTSHRYQIFGIGLSEPTGPEIIDPSQDPFAPCDKTTSDFCYPNDRLSPEPFIIVNDDEVSLPNNVANPAWLDANIWYWFG